MHKSIIYGYLQDNLDTKKLQIDEDYIYTDDGITRTNFNKLIDMIKPNDVIVINSINSLGSNYYEILNNYQIITKEKNAIIKVLDNPLLNDTINDVMVSNIVMDVLHSLLNNEKKTSKKRQLDGIKQAKENGVIFGRPKSKTPDNIDLIFDKYFNKKITNEKAAELIGVSRATFFRMVKARREELAGGVNE